MTQNKEMIDWFNNYFYNCYYVKHDDFPESLFMFYDINYARQLKLAKLEGIDYVEKTDITGVCLFEQDWKYKWFCCNYTLIWNYLRDIYSFSYDDFQSFISDRLEEHSKMNVLTPLSNRLYEWIPLEEHSKMNVLTPLRKIHPNIDKLEEHSKMNILTPLQSLGQDRSLLEEHPLEEHPLEEHSKMNVLTPIPQYCKTFDGMEEHSKMNILSPTNQIQHVMNVLTPYMHILHLNY